MACGKPIIASLDGSGAKIVDEARCGVISPAEDSIKLSKAIKKIISLDKNHLAEMGKNGRTYYEKEFDKKFLLKRLEKIFTSI